MRDNDSRLLTAVEVCGLLRVSRTKLWKMRKQGDIKHIPRGKRVFFLTAHVEDYMRREAKGAVTLR